MSGRVPAGRAAGDRLGQGDDGGLLGRAPSASTGGPDGPLRRARDGGSCEAAGTCWAAGAGAGRLAVAVTDGLACDKWATGSNRPGRAPRSLPVTVRTSGAAAGLRGRARLLRRPLVAVVGARPASCLTGAPHDVGGLGATLRRALRSRAAFRRNPRRSEAAWPGPSPGLSPARSERATEIWFRCRGAGSRRIRKMTEAGASPS